MEISLYQKPEYSKLFKAYYAEKKLTKSLINSVDIPTLTLDLSSNTSLSLRQSGQMLIGLLKILLHKTLLVLSEIDDFFQMFIETPKKVQKSKTAATQLITLNPKKVLLSIEEPFTGSYVSSTRDSIELGRNIANVSSITLNEVNYTPHSIKEFIELEDKDSVMQVDSPDLRLNDLNFHEINTPNLSVKFKTPASKKKKNISKIKPDVKTVIEVSREIDTKDHVKIGKQELSLGFDDIFVKPFIPVPDAILQAFKEMKVETFEFGVVPEVLPEVNEYNIEHVEDPPEEIPQKEEEEKELCEELIEKVKKIKGKAKFSKVAGVDRKESSNNFYGLMMLGIRGSVMIEQKDFFEEIFIKVNN